MKSSSGGEETLEWQQTLDGREEHAVNVMAGWQHGHQWDPSNPKLLGFMGVSHHPECVEQQSHTGTREPTTAMEERGKMGQPIQRKDENLPLQLQWVRMTADGVCARGSVSTWVCMGLELLVIDARKLFHDL